MKVLILGATGPTGSVVVERALQCGDDVTVLVRRPEALADAFAGHLTVLTGDATARSDLSAAMVGQDAVISALGRGTSVRAQGFFTAAADAVVSAATTIGVSRLVWLSSFGVGQTYQHASFVQKLMYRTFLRDIYANKAQSETTIRSSGLDWTLVYPSSLTNGPARGTYRVGDTVPMTQFARISRADVGDFLHKAAHDRQWIRRDAVLTD